MVLLRPILLMASSLCCAAAQSSTFAAETTSTATASSSSDTPKVHRVDVGAGGYMFNPNITIADPGDTVMFVFYPTNHSVIRGEYTGSDACGNGGCNPCVPYDMIHSGGGFNSTNVLTQKLPPADSLSSTTVTFNITVNSTDPIWYYCDAIGSCHPNGMVGVINPAKGQTVATQKEAAVKAPYQLAPDSAWPAEGAPVGAETATVSGLSQPTNTALNGYDDNDDSSHHGLSGGAIAGIAIGGVAVLLLAAALFYYVGRSKAYKDAFHNKSDTAASNAEKKDSVAQWVQPPPGGIAAPLSSTSTYADNRFSYQTQPFMSHQQAAAGGGGGTFLGYNRQTGAPEFASEVPMDRTQHQSWISHTTGPSPQLNQGGFHSPNQRYEVAGDMPERVEKP